MKVTPESIQKACDEVAQILIQKNHDYGNSVEEQYQEYGDASLHIRLEDKLRRLKNLSKNKAKIKEKKAETWIDAAGYSVLAYIIHKEEELLVTKPTRSRGSVCWKGTIAEDLDD